MIRGPSRSWRKIGTRRRNLQGGFGSITEEYGEKEKKEEDRNSFVFYIRNYKVLVFSSIYTENTIYVSIIVF